MKRRHLAWVATETEAKRHLKQHLAPFLALARHASALVEHAVDVVGLSRVPTSGEVQARLLVQSSTQLRGISLVVERGYALQGLAAGATLYELASSVAFIGTDEERATKWMSHSKVTTSYPPSPQRREAVGALLRGTGIATTEIEKQVSILENDYDLFCVAKHGNPIAVRSHAVARGESSLRLFHGPIGDRNSIMLGRRVLFRGSQLVGAAAGLFVKSQVGDLPRPTAVRFRDALGVFGEKLVAAAKAAPIDPAIAL